MMKKRNNKNLNKLKFDINAIKNQAIVNAIRYKNKENISTEKYICEAKDNKKVIIELQEVSKSFNKGINKVEAVKNINLKLYEKENVALLGGNGAGKTSLVEIIAGLNKPSSGNINYFFSDTNFRKKMGIQFQDSTYAPGITVKRVIKFISDIYESSLDKNELNALISIFGIDEFYHKRASGLSGGQSQRLNCLLSILHKPSFIILDELSTGLDVTVRTRIKTFIKEYAEENNATILIVSHDMDEVNYIADRIIIMQNGVICVDAYKSDIISQYGSIPNCIEKYI